MMILQPKSKGAGIMVSVFIDEHHGYLKLMEDEYTRATGTPPGLKRGQLNLHSEVLVDCFFSRVCLG